MAKPPFVISALIGAWLLAAGLGFLAFGAYHAAPSPTGSTPDRWPLATTLPCHDSLPTLVIFIHPRCPCSSASLVELDRFLARHGGQVASRIVAFRPEGEAEGWELSGSRPGVPIFVDIDGREAARFGVETSGHVLLFDPAGRRLYSGGITIARGHRGDNPGLDRLREAIRGRSAQDGTAPVFGCPIFPSGEGRPRRTVR